MFIIIVVALLLGIWRFRSAEYFKWVGITFLWVVASVFSVQCVWHSRKSGWRRPDYSPDADCHE